MRIVVIELGRACWDGCMPPPRDDASSTPLVSTMFERAREATLRQAREATTATATLRPTDGDARIPYRRRLFPRSSHICLSIRDACFSGRTEEFAATS
jgi:hypothetical protein